jgi:hypothetical protein
MKNRIALITVSLLIILGNLAPKYAAALNHKAKDPIVIEVTAKQKTIEEALTAVKMVLLQKKFISANGVQKNSLNAIRTTMSKADYFVADATATQSGGKITVAITFVKVGTGFLNLKKVAEEVKAELEK